jgi:hypothetical protein
VRVAPAALWGLLARCDIWHAGLRTLPQYKSPIRSRCCPSWLRVRPHANSLDEVERWLSRLEKEHRRPGIRGDSSTSPQGDEIVCGHRRVCFGLAMPQRAQVGAQDFKVAIFVGLPFRRRRFRDQPVDFRDAKQPSMIGIMSVASVHNRFTATGA